MKSRVNFRPRFFMVLAALLVSGVVHAQGVLYLVVDEGTDAFYTVNTSTGAVTQIGSPGAQNGSAEGLAPSATPNSFLYTVDNNSNLDRINTDGSGFTNVGGAMTDCDRGLAYNTTTGILYGSDNNTFCSINQTTSVTTSLPSPPGSDTEGLAADPVNNYVYGIDTSENLVRFDVVANTWSTIGPTVNISSGSDIGLAYDPGTQTLYAVDSSGILYSVNRTTGLATVVGDTGLGTGLDVGLAFVVDGSSGARATFQVTKDFTDDNPSEVEVTISCTTGLPIEQSQGVSESQSIEFVVVEYDDGELNCEITEEVPDGYDVTYFDGTSNSSQSCEFVGVAHGAENSCRITNTPEPVDIDIEKDWVLEGTTNGEGIDLRYDVTIWCSSEIVNGTQIGGEAVESPSGILGCGEILLAQENPQLAPLTWCKTFSGEGPLDATHTAQVIPDYPLSLCLVFENVYDSAVETSNGCFFVSVSAGQGASCTITNTVFFEGIPTLNQYGLAMLALLMLGIGFVSFRRFG